ncbi:hypothetical protein [Nonomuraea salmonea]|uniref:hypothetical protein n=1 Tax=Nonomuraea salmonea TaxID=46181 RepID=UPI002FEAD3B2
MDARHHDGVGGVEHVEVVVGQDGVAGLAAYRPAPFRAGDHLVQALARRCAGRAEDLAGHAEVERGEVVERDDDDPMGHGLILAHIGFRATRGHVPGSFRMCA